MPTANDNPSRVNFTPGRVVAFKCPNAKAEVFLWDTQVPGLGLRARKGGGKSYIFQGRINSRSLRISIGSPDSWDIDTVRAEARRLRMLIDSGKDPRQEKKEREVANEQARHEQERAAITLGVVWPQYIESREQDWSQTHHSDHLKAMQAPGLPRKRSKDKTTAGVLYALRGDRLAELTPERVAHWLKQEKKTRPTVAARGYRLLRACLTWCNEQPHLKGVVNVTELMNGTVRRALPKPKAKSDALQREQLGLWFETVRTIPNPVISAYLQGLLLTGSRREEMARLRWVDVDFQWKSMNIRDKVEGERIIPLTPYLSQLLVALPRRNEWVFSSTTSATGRLTDAYRAHTKALQVAGLPHVSLHGLRRSFGTLSEWVECPVGVVAQIQGHKPSALAEKHYRRRPLDLLRKWHTKIEGWVLEQAGIEQPSSEVGEGLRVVK